MLHRLLLIAAIFLCVSAPAVAQKGGLQLPPKPKPVAKDPAPSAEEQSAEEAEPEVPNYWVPAETEPEKLFVRFELLGDGRPIIRKRFLEELRGMGLSTRDVALKALFSPYAPSVVLGAEILEWVGDPPDAEKLIDAAIQVTDVQAVGVCLETARRLGSGQLPASAVKGLDHPRHPVRGVFEARLKANPNPDFIPKLLQFLQFGRDKDLRLRSVRLLAGYAQNLDARRGLRAALKANSVDVASVAVLALAGTGNREDLQYLREEFLQADASKEAAYLLFALLKLQQQRSELLFSAEMQPRMRAMLEEDDPFVSGTAAAGLAACVFRDSLEGPVGSLDQSLPFVLVRAVGGVVFYPQYARFAPLAETSLRRVTGVEFPEQAGSAWIRWLEQNREHFTLVRGHIEVLPDELPSLRVEWGTESHGFHALAGPQGALAQDRLLGPHGQQILLQILLKAGVLDAGILPGVLGLAEAPQRFAIDIAVGDRRKRLDFHGSAGNPWADQMHKELEQLFQQNSWQALAGHDAEGRRFLSEQLEKFDTHPLLSEERTQALLELSAGRILGLDLPTLRNWVGELEALPAKEKYWSLELSQEFLQILPRVVQEEELAQRLVSLSLTVPRAALLPSLLEVLTTLVEPQKSDLLLQAMSVFAVEDLNPLLGDDRLEVRVAVVRALAKKGSAAIPSLVHALDDIHPLVVRQAIRGLGQIGDPKARGAVLPYAAPGLDSALRSESLWALGEMGDSGSLDTLQQACLDADVAVRVSAIEAVSAIPGGESEKVLRELFPAFVGTALEGSYMNALMRRGAGVSREALRPYLLHSEPRLATRAAILDGSLGDPSAALSLMQLLPGNPRDAELLEALASTFAVDFRQTPDPAGTYQAWWEDNQKLDSAEWLRRTAEDSGFSLAQGFQDPTKVSAKDSVATLLEMVKTGPAFARPLAAYFLYALTGVDAPVILARTAHAEVLRRVKPWQEWLTQ